MRDRSWLGISAVLAAGIVLAASSARAQFEVDPDHFDSPNMVPFDRPKTEANSEAAGVTVRYEGRFNLPYAVQCNGKILRPGKYSISLRVDGKVGQATLNQKDQTTGIGGVVQKRAHKAGSDALVVELNRGSRNLSNVQIAQLDLILDTRLPVASPSDSKSQRIDRVPLTETTLKKF